MMNPLNSAPATHFNSAAVEIPPQSTLAQRIGCLCHKLARALTVATERRVWQQRDRHGNVTWFVYDPVVHQHLIFVDETELRQWLECPTSQPKTQRSRG